MKNLHFCLFFLLSNLPIFAQQTQLTHTLVSDITKCEGDTFRVFQNMGIERRSVTQYRADCSRSLVYSNPNYEDFSYTMDNLIYIDKEPFQVAGDNYCAVHYIEYVAKETTTITVINIIDSKIEYEDMRCTDCSLFPDCHGQIITYKYIYNITVLPKKPPVLRSDKDLVREEPVILTSSGCIAASLVSQIKEHECSSSNEGLLSYTDLDHKLERFVTRPIQIYKSRCVYPNSCYSDWSAPVKVRMIPASINTCNNPQIDDLDQMPIPHTQPSAIGSYHRYFEETVICKKTNPNCTKEKVFSFLQSSKIYQVAVVDDFKGGSLIPPVGNLSNLIHDTDNSKIENCNVVNLPGLGTIYFGLILQHFQGATNLRQPLPPAPISNPVIMLVDPQNYTISNYTLPGHILSPGKVIRTVVEDCDEIKIVTVGYGDSWMKYLPPINGFDTGFFASLMAKWINEFDGKNLFNNIDLRLKEQFLIYYR